MNENPNRRAMLRNIAGAGAAALGVSEAAAAQKKPESVNFDEKLTLLENEAKALLSKINQLRTNKKESAEDLAAIPQIMGTLNLEREMFDHARKIGNMVPRGERH